MNWFDQHIGTLFIATKNFTIAAGLVTAPWWMNALSGVAAVASQLAAIVGLGVGILTIVKLIRDLRKP
jgi:hypothetical protein